jgi:hypothetical protein
MHAQKQFLPKNKNKNSKNPNRYIKPFQLITPRLHKSQLLDIFLSKLQLLKLERSVVRVLCVVFDQLFKKAQLLKILSSCQNICNSKI